MKLEKLKPGMTADEEIEDRERKDDLRPPRARLRAALYVHL